MTLPPAPVHQPVMVRQVCELLLGAGGSRFIDCTVGCGGHAAALIAAAPHEVELLGIDLDPSAIEMCRRRFAGHMNIRLQQGSYVELDRLARAAGFEAADGILADLGQSSMQLDDPARGFSHRGDGPLDMRYDPTTGITAAELVNHLSTSELADLIWRYSQERQARRIAAAIAKARPLTTTGQLERVVRRVGSGRFINKTLARVFMALRVAVNRETEALAGMLSAAVGLLRPGGRLVVIAYDSLQDRPVKVFFQQEARGCRCPPGTPVCRCGGKARLKVLTRHPWKPDAEETAGNSRARSARLRAAERV